VLTAVLIDDERHCLNTLSRDLAGCCPDVQILEQFADPQAALAWLKTHTPDLVFLDIQMPGMNGFELLEALHPVPFSVVFTTAYSEFAAQAFRISAIDFLVKPIDEGELMEAVERARKAKGAQNALQERLEALLGNLERGNPDARLALPAGEGYHFAYIRDILYCEANGNFSFVYLPSGKKLFVSRSLKEMEALLGGFSFCRIHHSYLVNLKQMSRYLRGDGGQVEMANGHLLPVAKAKKADFLEKIK
jgi:two-component system, LytTR family, response regulator